MRGLNAKNLAVYRVNKFYIKKTKITETLLVISVSVSTIINTLYFNLSLHKNPSDLNLPQITRQSPSFQKLLTYPKTYLDL